MNTSIILQAKISMLSCIALQLKKIRINKIPLWGSLQRITMFSLFKFHSWRNVVCDKKDGSFAGCAHFAARAPLRNVSRNNWYAKLKVSASPRWGYSRSRSTNKTLWKVSWMCLLTTLTQQSYHYAAGGVRREREGSRRIFCNYISLNVKLVFLPTPPFIVLQRNPKFICNLAPKGHQHHLVGTNSRGAWKRVACK